MQTVFCNRTGFVLIVVWDGRKMYFCSYINKNKNAQTTTDLCNRILLFVLCAVDSSARKHRNG